MNSIWRMLLSLLLWLALPPLCLAQDWQLIWQDEFNGSIGPDWVFEIGNGNGGWGNNELEYYRQANASIENGQLVITAKREDIGGYRYTSARMKTQGRKSVRYGRIEARIAMPSVRGLWPAFWMLGSNLAEVGWPRSGEIDVVEHINTDAVVHGTAHWQAADGSHASQGGQASVAVGGFHVYAVEWDPQVIKWFVDGQLYHVLDIVGGVGGTDAFEKDFFLLLNLAVGGNWPGFNIDEGALPAKLVVDYVRVYQDAARTATAWASLDAPARFIRHKNGRGRVDAKVAPAQDGNWTMSAGLAGTGVSFQSQNLPGQYLRHRAGEVWLDPDDGSQLFKEEATFLLAQGLCPKPQASFLRGLQRQRKLPAPAKVAAVRRARRRPAGAQGRHVFSRPTSAGLRGASWRPSTTQPCRAWRSRPVPKAGRTWAGSTPTTGPSGTSTCHVAPPTGSTTGSPAWVAAGSFSLNGPGAVRSTAASPCRTPGAGRAGSLCRIR